MAARIRLKIPLGRLWGLSEVWCTRKYLLRSRTVSPGTHEFDVNARHLPTLLSVGT